MQKWLKLGIAGISLLASQVQAAELQLTVNGQEPADMVCYVSCPNPNGFLDVPVEYSCAALPAIDANCKLIVLSATKASLEDVIRNLQILSGQEVSNGK